ncbi:MAG: hypothetical protein C9356_11965 [Oleiphilus sp.]|nr:MAG: hypothetical protein C9356_11965 [Oleiphilus sp.]
MNEVTWVCEACKTENVDLRSETALPMCGGCEKHFDWDDLIHVSDDCDAYLNAVDKLSRQCFAGRAAVDLVEEPDAAVHSLQDSFNNNVTVEEALKRVRRLQAKELWGHLGDIPIDVNEQIEEPFLHFAKGTERLVIWHWFEESFDLCLAKHLMFPS